MLRKQARETRMTGRSDSSPNTPFPARIMGVSPISGGEWRVGGLCWGLGYPAFNSTRRWGWRVRKGSFPWGMRLKKEGTTGRASLQAQRLLSHIHQGPAARTCPPACSLPRTQRLNRRSSQRPQPHLPHLTRQPGPLAPGVQLHQPSSTGSGAALPARRFSASAPGFRGVDHAGGGGSASPLLAGGAAQVRSGGCPGPGGHSRARPRPQPRKWASAPAAPRRPGGLGTERRHGGGRAPGRADLPHLPGLFQRPGVHRVRPQLLPPLPAPQLDAGRRAVPLPRVPAAVVARRPAAQLGAGPAHGEGAAPAPGPRAARPVRPPLGAAAPLLRGRPAARVPGVPGVPGAPGPRHGARGRGLRELPGKTSHDSV